MVGTVQESFGVTELTCAPDVYFLPLILTQTAVVGTFIQGVSFSDDDTGANAALTYSITAPVSECIDYNKHHSDVFYLIG